MGRNRGQRKAAAIIGLAVVLGVTGCAGNEEEPESAREDILIQDELLEEAGESEEGNEKEEAGGSESEALEQEEAGGDTEESGGENASNSMAARETEHLGGKVQDVRADGMTFAQTTLLDEDGMVTLLSVEDAKKISVQFTSDTKVERWTIQDGGADIDMREADIADLETGMGVGLEGYFAGETFIAARIIIEEGGQQDGTGDQIVQEKAVNHEELVGNVRSVSQDSFVISKTKTWSEGDADFAVDAAPGYEKEEDLITVYAAESCVYQYKTVKNGGVNPEDIRVREGRFADLQENIAVIMKGNWRSDGAFFADTIEMMIFV